MLPGLEGRGLGWPGTVWFVHWAFVGEGQNWADSRCRLLTFLENQLWMPFKDPPASEKQNLLINWYSLSDQPIKRLSTLTLTLPLGPEVQPGHRGSAALSLEQLRFGRDWRRDETGPEVDAWKQKAEARRDRPLNYFALCYSSTPYLRTLFGLVTFSKTSDCPKESKSVARPGGTQRWLSVPNYRVKVVPHCIRFQKFSPLTHKDRTGRDLWPWGGFVDVSQGPMCSPVPRERVPPPKWTRSTGPFRLSPD